MRLRARPTVVVVVAPGRQRRHLLESTDLTVDRIATEAGLGTGASLRRHLTAVIGVSPTACRHTFRTASRSPA
ncbi:hypothetical protein GCM10010346_18050 [Streptomyces chryseus]|uniref:HTH araC/xylS-type domain-containing protein n=1 Tax=Streptomyces chryseus TaxID=68186 RepID=A0ABQ3DHQ6_9ACTN|nr:hypothetical protein GCM10010346_18050 [Streptomyces chryseus]